MFGAQGLNAGCWGSSSRVRGLGYPGYQQEADLRESVPQQSVKTSQLDKII